MGTPDPTFSRHRDQRLTQPNDWSDQRLSFRMIRYSITEYRFFLGEVPKLQSTEVQCRRRVNPSDSSQVARRPSYSRCSECLQMQFAVYILQSEVYIQQIHQVLHISSIDA